MMSQILEQRLVNDRLVHLRRSRRLREQPFKVYPLYRDFEIRSVYDYSRKGAIIGNSRDELTKWYFHRPFKAEEATQPGLRLSFLRSSRI